MKVGPPPAAIVLSALHPREGAEHRSFFGQRGQRGQRRSYDVPIDDPGIHVQMYTCMDGWMDVMDDWP